MAEPANTPMPPSTPISATPRSASPAQSAPPLPPGPLPPLPAFPVSSFHSAVPTIKRHSASSSTSSSHADGAGGSSNTKNLVVLHIGDPIQYNPQTYAALAASFSVVRPTAAERARPQFLQALREWRWGDFDAVLRPFWGTGGEMGRWDRELVSLLPPSVRVFASAGAGFDWADVELLGERGIVYCNGGLAAAEAVADFAVALVIGTFRSLPYCLSSSASSRAFEKCHDDATPRSRNLRSQTLGLVGLGNIGQQLALKFTLAFGMTVLYYDIERKPAALEAKLGVRFCASLEALVRSSDCVVLCTPSGAGRLINAQSLEWFRPGGRLVNVARGSLVDEEALADALEAGRLGAAALDVHANEPAVHPRLAALAGDRVMLTCHNAGGTVETHVGFEELAMRNVMAVLGGGAPITPVNLQYLKVKGGG
ncbi:2-ketogluconate reductase [Apiospora kogelbergensis]|uniref:2-ketogluconate reductase n=1 Tax=Apiospora kogelbergensis TaxID=1337665 RepID=A0AAW0Q8C1_9PEZI